MITAGLIQHCCSIGVHSMECRQWFQEAEVCIIILLRSSHSLSYDQSEIISGLKVHLGYLTCPHMAGECNL